jgi:hypothetical protein
MSGALKPVGGCSDTFVCGPSLVLARRAFNLKWSAPSELLGGGAIAGEGERFGSIQLRRRLMGRRYLAPCPFEALRRRVPPLRRVTRGARAGPADGFSGTSRRG